MCQKHFNKVVFEKHFDRCFFRAIVYEISTKRMTIKHYFFKTNLEILPKNRVDENCTLSRL